MGLLGGHDDQRPVGEFGQDARVTPLLLLFVGHPGICEDHIESGPQFNASKLSYSEYIFNSIVSPSLYWSVRSHTDHMVSTSCWSH